MTKLNILKKVLEQMIQNIDSGNCNLSDDECIELIDSINYMTNTQNKYSVYQAVKYLGISRATFDNYVRDGKIPPGRKQVGFKEKFYLKGDLDKIKETLKKHD